MVCPHSGGSTQAGGERGVERRQFVLAAVAIGGTNALAACVDRTDDDPASSGDTADGTGGDGPTELSHENPAEFDPEGGVPFVYRNLGREQAQFAWNRYLDTDALGAPRPPRHQSLVFADYTGDGVPTASDRDQFEAALGVLESAYEWSNDGLLFTVGYAPAYFDRFSGDLPETVDLPKPAPLAEFESPVLDSYEVCFHFGSDHPEAILGAEEALFGNVEAINGVSVDHTVDGILEKRDRRTGFIGEGLPAANQDVEGIPDSEPVEQRAPLFMGFQSQHAARPSHPYHGETEDTYVRNQNSEYGTMITEGRFQGGTTQHVSRIHLDLHDWYEDRTGEERLHQMFATQVGDEDIDVDELSPETHLEDIEEQGTIGHTEKLIRGSDQGLHPLLRRDFNTTDENRAGVHFVSLQEGISEFVRMRELMNGTEFSDGVDDIGTRENNGILEFIEVKNRANFLVPPPGLRSFPTPE